jgi:acetyl-CoA synthetase
MLACAKIGAAHSVVYGGFEVESALVSHPDLSEAAAIGLPHELKANAIHAYVILRAGVEGGDKLAEVLQQSPNSTTCPLSFYRDL